MYELKWISKKRSKSWKNPYGCFVLPKSIGYKMGGRVVVITPKFGYLIGPKHRRSFFPKKPLLTLNSDPTRNEQQHLLWIPIATSHNLMEDEHTNKDQQRKKSLLLKLFDDQQQILTLNPGPNVVGRHPNCDISLSHPSVSNYHCLIEMHASALRLIDLNSQNGTYVNSVKVTDILLHKPALLTLGNKELFLQSTPTSFVKNVPLPSPAMKEIELLIRRVAKTNISLYIHGESGVGKDQLVHRIHTRSQRMGPLIILNAGAINSNLAGSELFGHVRGAFTGAHKDKTGAFICAHHGTMFLDEVAELPWSIQTELLRVIESHIVRPLGTHQEIPIDVRLITATHRDLQKCVKQGTFREDLFHRICVIPIHIPPLRERPQDIDAISQNFLSAMSPPRSLSSAAWKKLKTYHWPGNIRELINTLHRTCVLCGEKVLRKKDLMLLDEMKSYQNDVDELVRDTVLRVYHACGQDIHLSIKKLGMKRTVFYQHLRLARKLL